jgi:hypothetical protein
MALRQTSTKRQGNPNVSRSAGNAKNDTFFHLTATPENQRLQKDE